MHHAFEPPFSSPYDSMPPSSLDGDVVALGVLEERVQELMFCVIDDGPGDGSGLTSSGRISPLGLVGPAEGLPKESWQLRSAQELLDLKVCDMACGSGAFLVQACRYLAARLLEAWDAVERAHPGTLRITPEGKPASPKPC